MTKYSLIGANICFSRHRITVISVLPMRFTLNCLIFSLLTSPFLGAAEALETKADTVASVPESSVAILFGGLLWFLLLRKRA